MLKANMNIWPFFLLAHAQLKEKGAIVAASSFDIESGILKAKSHNRLF